jgi:quinol monooxygenase YgiN
MIIVHGAAVFEPSVRERWVAATRETVEASRAQPGNHLYLYAADVHRPEACHVFQLWEDRPSMERHIADPGHRAQLQRFAEMGARWESVTHYEIAEVIRKR